MVRIGIILMLLATASLASSDTQPTNVSPVEYACTALEIDCSDIAMPTIIYTDLMGALGLHGAYMPGDNKIFIDPDAPAHTLVHEVTHYVLYETGIVRDRCISEEASRRVHHKWEGTDYNDEWRKRYRC